MLKTKNIAAQPLPSFSLFESNLGMGASMGNSALWVHTKGTGALERVFFNELGRSLVGTVQLRYGARGRRLGAVASFDGHRGDDTYNGIYPETGTRRFEIHPAYQRVRFQLARVIDICETTFLPLTDSAPSYGDPAIAYVIANLCNSDDIPHTVRVTASAMLRGDTPADVHAYFDASANALVASNATHEDWTRVFAVSEKPEGYCANLDVGSTYDPAHLHNLQNDIATQGDLLGHLQLDVPLDPGEERQLAFTVTLSSRGADDALRTLREAGSADDMLERTIEHLENELRVSRVLTPDATINQGALWSKVNMRRVMATYPYCNAFTNDPGKYAIVVVRDCAWFVYGNDHFVPEFSRHLLDAIALRQYPSGKLPEYIDAVTGIVDDYALNINDDTPLFILAVSHHFRSAGDAAWLREIYQNVAAAARYIMSQIDERGLVFCSADDARGGVWAIAGWRNIIDNYKINGAVTEINAECVAALRAAGDLAEDLGGFDDDARDFRRASDSVKAAMDEHLINPNNGLYYLNIDVDGNPRTDVTGDEIFPVMFRACSEETGFRIISRLNCEDFWTSAGLRTVSRYDPRFDPSANAGLLGGVWPGLTWWYATAAARYHPEVMVRALSSSFQHYGSDPKMNNTAPGQFSEWFHGESLENRGMRLSPWEPPRFLSAAIEGVCGLMPRPGTPYISPLIPSHWSWAGIRELPYHGSYLSYFIVREAVTGFRVYSTAPVECEWDVTLYERDISDIVRVYADSAVALGLAREDGAAVLIGNTSSQTIHTPVVVTDPKQSDRSFHVRAYDSERCGWDDFGILSMEDIRGNAFSIEAGGFRLIELTALEQ